MIKEAGLKENWKQFSILVIINAFVGAMVGLERTIFPDFAQTQFGVASHTAVLSFIMAFGLAKAITNYYMGKFADRVGRKNLLIIGWILAIPVPFILINAPTWTWVVFANLLLGMSQGLAWSSTVVMKIDLVGDRNRGLAMGFNEFAGYFAVGITAYATGIIASEYGLVPYPFYLGIGISILGLLSSIAFVKDTGSLVSKEKSNEEEKAQNVFWNTTFLDRNLSSVTQAGLVNNLNDGMIWGLLPAWLLTQSFDTASIGLIAATYPTVWGIGQLFTGRMSDVYSKKKLLFWGMLVQGIAIALIPNAGDVTSLLIIGTILGLGTATVYPTFLTAIASMTHPRQRAESIGTFRLWRDLGYVAGAVLSGIIADQFGLSVAIICIGFITIASALVIQVRMQETADKD